MTRIRTGFPSRLRRLDDALEDAAIDGDPMLLSELDGYLTAIVLSPDPVEPVEWLMPVWGIEGGGAPFDDPLDNQMVNAMVLARHDEIARELARGKPKPIFDTDPTSGELDWGPWIEGFDQGMQLRPDGWYQVSASQEAEPDAAGGFGYLVALIEIVRNETTLTSIEINELSDQAAGLIGIATTQLLDWRRRHVGDGFGTAAPSAKIGRNDPCPCGSGKKYKRCCAA